MSWNILLNNTNKEKTKEKYKQYLDKVSKVEEYKVKLNEYISQVRKEQPIIYKLRDRFLIIYKVFVPIAAFWLGTAILLGIRAFTGGGWLWGIILILYLIITAPLAIISMLVPTVKFFVYDLPKKINEVKVYASTRYMIAVFFEENRIVTPIVRKLDKDGMFEYDKVPYIADKTSSFLSSGKVMLAFYLKGIPNPLKFNFRKYLNKFIEAKKENPEAKITDFEDEVIDVSFNSENLKDYKKAKLFTEFFRDPIAEQNKIIFAIIGLCSIFAIVMVVMYILKGG